MELGANLKKKKLRNSSLSFASMVNMRENKVASEISLISVLLFLLQLFFSLNQVNSYEYDPVDNLAVNCGSSGDIPFDNRKWVGDVDGTKLFSTIEQQTGQKSVKAEALNLPSLVSKVPFGSARLSYSNFTYSFPVVTNGPVFLRLHFYPTSYAAAAANFEPSNALFSVKVGSNLTLLKDFNASLWLKNDEKTVTKEYYIQIAAGERLNVTFLPSTPTNHSDAAYYAFINGIEVVSMPPFLYYTDLTNPNPDDFNIKYVGRSIPYQVLNDKALEMLYRVNVGQNQVPPSQDTGMFRYWDNDFPRYLEKEYPQSVQSGFGLHLNYRNNAVPNYTAPAGVYLTARSYGMYVTENYNVTWNFEVDSEFTYMVRLHFCEFDLEIQREGDRVFQIFIADTLVEPSADVISWSGGNLVPVHKDYAVPVDIMPSQGRSSETQRRVNLSVKLQRLPDGYSVYRDVIMNGIEIFKISDENNLAGPNPKPLNLSSNQQQILPSQSSKKSKSSAIIIVAAVAAVSAYQCISVK